MKHWRYSPSPAHGCSLTLLFYNIQRQCAIPNPDFKGFLKCIKYLYSYIYIYIYIYICNKVELFKTILLRRYSGLRHIWAYFSTAVWRLTLAVLRAQSFHRANAESGSYTTLDLKGRWVYCYCRGHISSIKSSASGLKTFLAHREEFSPSGFDLILYLRLRFNSKACKVDWPTNFEAPWIKKFLDKRVSSGKHNIR